MPKWTDEQQKAIDSRDGTVLVSAAAGSGKTAVLVERVIRRLMDKEKPCSADRLLIVTFTRAATQQMRDRIFQAISDRLRENPDDSHLRHQLVMLPFAKISTIDSFCNDIVRENFHDIEFSCDYRMLEGAQLKLVEQDAMEITLNELYKENSDEFAELVNILANGTDDSALSDLIKRLYNNSIAFARPEAWLESLKTEYESDLPLAESRWGKIIIGQLSETVKYCKRIAEKMRNYLDKDEVAGEKYSANVNDIDLCLAELEKAIDTKSWDNIGNAVNSFKLSTMGRLPKGYTSYETTFIKEQKSKISNLIKGMIPLFCSTEEENREDMEYLRPLIEKILFAVHRYGEILALEKQKINSVDFADITHLALRLLVRYNEDGGREKTELAKSLSQNFDEILVDEFQDINELQETLFWAVSKDDTNMFTVGDVKQSIYRFRQAMPEIFLRRRDAMDEYNDGNYPGKIILDRNFRSRSGVTENVNFVFRQIMSRTAGGLDYDKNEELVAAADYAPCDFPQAELHIIGELEDGSKVSREKEAQHIADIINNTIESKMQVKDGDATRDVQFRDFCILMRATGGGRAETYAEVLTRNNIPVYVSNKTGFFAASEISIMLNLMRVIDNPIQDIPLLAVMLSPFYGFTANELAKMRIDERKKPIYHCLLKSADNGNQKSKAFLESMENLRMLSSTLSCTEFVRELYDVTGCKAIASAMKNGSQRNANLNMLLEYASKYEESGKRGLTGFIRFIDRVQRQDTDLESASSISEAANVVRIMTIHKSKGLEFPVCILADLNNGITNDNQRSVAAFHPDYGLCFDRRDGRTKCKYSTVGRKALTIAEKNSSVSEELRVLYVAMTRAKERLICVTRYDNITKYLGEFSLFLNGSEPVSPFLILGRNCMADWILTAYLRHPDAGVMRKLAQAQDLTVLEAKEGVTVQIVNNVDDVTESEKEETEAVSDSEILEEIKTRTAYEYPYASLAEVMAKSSPSELEATGFDTSYFASSKPQFLSKSGLNPAQRGTATHKFMEFFDYRAESYDVDVQAAKMVAENHLTENEAAALEKDKLERFFTSDIARRIQLSPLLLREKKVTVGIRAGELYPELPENTADETVVIQGYIDCAFEEDGELVIVDYKTDRGVTMEEIRERYRAQLKMYELALRECTGKSVKGTLIYSFENGTYISL